MPLIETIKPNKFHSFFMFPFQFDERYDLEKLIKIINEKNSNWGYDELDIKEGIHYNEYFYFYPHLRNILFSKKNKKFDNNMKRAFFRAQKITAKKLNYTVILNDDTEYSLPLEQIYLHLFENKTGILVFEIMQLVPKYNLQQYLKFLDMGRRIYIPYIKAGKDIPTEINKNGMELQEVLQAVKDLQCPKKIIIDENQKLEHDFVNDFNFDKNKPEISVMNNIIIQLLDSDNFKFDKEDYKSTIDDRMYSHTYFEITDNKEINGNDLFLKQTKEYFDKDCQTIDVVKESLKVWYQMIFVDSSKEPLCNNTQMLKELLEKATYKRWTGSGSLFGFSRYSSVVVSNWDVIRHHFESMYYQIALLNLFYRNSLLLFSDRAIQISENIKKRWAMSDLQNLQEDIILFENKYWFREISAQEQGIEMFDMWEKQFRNNLLLNDVKQGIKELYTYFDLQREKKNSNKLKILTIVAGLFFPITIAIDIIVMDYNDQSFIWYFMKKNNLINYGLGISIFGFFIMALYLLKEPALEIKEKIEHLLGKWKK